MNALHLSLMTQDEAETIAAWKYPPPYNFYDMTADEEDYEEFIHPEKRSRHTYSVYDRHQLIGFFTINPLGERTVDIGLGMHPQLTGRGKGKAFLEQGLGFVNHQYQADSFTLSVAAFNQRAISVYEKAGFCRKETFIQATNGGKFEFVKMEKNIHDKR
ncbi:GNAT family N-acetyltransferase [Halobacillus litoralis]|uniref:GNAT family N-acetyltransferase n=1 Tax=Halobacillus litoralis TaxID=45668 RepID=A0A410MER7_9BACI|nr:GNAT family protein [Halobacillus litoralis]QAS53234.1 GNAT family N-acetyltransferase [Halobacillus litoralis]